jgi:hypothetical protein
MKTNRRVIASIFAALFWMSGCGALPEPPIPEAFGSLDLETLAEIQNDERLTDDEKREQIRELTGAPNDDAGDRLVEFLLTAELPMGV